MHKTMTAAMAAVSLLALTGCRQTASGGNGAGNENVTAPAAAGSIDGTWKADIESVQFDQKPDEFLLQGGQYSCKSCVPAAFTIAADGAFHPVSLPYADSYAVKVVDDHNIVRMQKKAGRQVGETKVTISADGNTLTGSFNDTSVPNAPPSKGEFTETRVGPAPAGAHAVSGQWKPAKLANFNAEQLTTAFRVDADMLHLSSPSGYSYDAKLDGTDVPIKGDIANTTASVKKLDDGSYQETDKRDGKVVGVSTFTAGADGKLHVVSEDKLAGSTVKYDMTRQ
jgi:hypothetical protein